jgi:glucose-6-phosphate dehydrogenase assembly protein OpcA
VADAVILDRWEGTDVKLGVVLDTLSALRRRSARSASRTSVMTLVVVANDDDEAARASRAMAPVGTHHPARVILLRPDRRARRPGLDAQLNVCGATTGDHTVSYEEIALTVRSVGCDHLDSIIEPFTLSDLPVVVWYPGALPDPSDCLLPVADAVLVDSLEAGGLPAFARLQELARRLVVVDLSWERLLPWRELLAGLFEGAVYRPFVTGVSSIAVAGKTGPRHVLAGWLCSRLGLPTTAVDLTDARHVSVRLEGAHAGIRATFEAVRAEGERVVRAGAVVHGGPSHREILPLPDDSLAWSLGRALTHLRRDEVWEEALGAAVVLGR